MSEDFDVQVEKERFLSSITEGDYEDLGVTGLRHHGGYSSGFCPIHQDEKKRSLSLRPSGKTGYLDWICFAGCGESRARNFIEMVMLLEGRDPDDHRSFVETLKELVTGERPVFAHRPSGNGKKPKPKADVDWAWFVEKCQGNVPTEIPVEMVPHGFTPESWRRALLVTGGGLMPDTTERRWEPEKPWLGKRRAWVWGTVSNDGSYVGAKLRWVDGPWTPYPDGDPEKCWSLGTAGLMGAFQLEDRPDVPVVVTEGEMDMGMGASVDGCYAWVSFSSFGPTTYERAGGRLAGRSVVATYDMDEAGRGHAAVAERCLAGVAAAYRDVSIPFGEGESGKDLRDWFEAGHTLDELVAVVDGTPLSSVSEPAADPDVAPSPAEEDVSSRPVSVFPSPGELPEFPLSAFPPVLRDVTETLADYFQMTKGTVATMVLGTLSASCAGKFSIRMSTDHVEKGVQGYYVIAANPSSFKSPLLTVLMEALDEHDMEMKREAKEARKRWLARKTVLEVDKAKLVSGIKGAEEESYERRELETKLGEVLEEIDENEEPYTPQARISDATLEFVGEVAYRQDGVVRLISAEPVALRHSTGLYKTGSTAPNTDIINQGYSCEPVSVGRLSRERQMTIIPRPAIAQLLAVQPGPVYETYANKNLREGGNLSRFDTVIEPDNVGTRTFAATIDQKAVTEFRRLNRGILSIRNERDEVGRVTIELQVEKYAKKVFMRFREANERELGPLGRYGMTEGWGGKMHGKVARVAALLHLAEHYGAYDSPVNDETIGKAIEIMRFFGAHAVRLFTGGTEGPTDDLLKIARYIDDRRLEFLDERVLNRNLADFRGADGLDRLHDVTDLLTEKGILETAERPPARGPKPKPQFRFFKIIADIRTIYENETN